MWRGIILIFATFVNTAVYAGLIGPAEFPKTEADLSFFDRMTFKSTDYNQIVESRYDDNGNCISGCSYVMPTWEAQLAAAERWNQLVREELIEEEGYIEEEDGSLTLPPIDEPQVTEFPSDTNRPPMYSSPDQRPTYTDPNFQNCAVKNTTFENRDIPYRNPLGYRACITSPYGPRKLNNKTFHHGTDFGVVTGTPVYAPANGVVEWTVTGNGDCGNGLQIRHSNGFTTRYCHFSSLAVKKGDKVSSGCLIGKTGATGQGVTGPHLHYAIYKNGLSLDPVKNRLIEPGHKRC